jgi:hypothetical protein
MFGVTVALTTIGVLAHFEGRTGVLACCEELKNISVHLQCSNRISGQRAEEHLYSLAEREPCRCSES